MAGFYVEPYSGIRIDWDIKRQGVSINYYPVGESCTLALKVTAGSKNIKSSALYLRRSNKSTGHAVQPPWDAFDTYLYTDGGQISAGNFREYNLVYTFASSTFGEYLFCGVVWSCQFTDGTSGNPVSQGMIGLDYVDSATANTPAISEFTAKRCDTNGNLSDEGQYIRNTIKGSIAPGMGWTAAQHTLRVGYRIQGSGSAFTWVNKTGFSAAINIDEKLNTGAVFAPGSVYEIRCELINNQRSITAYATSILPKAFANIHLSGSGYGVGIGQYSTATEENPKFECAYPAHFYGGAKDADGKAITAGPLIQAGLVAAQGNVASGNYRDTTVTFPTAFKTDTTPVVVVGFDSGSTSGTFGRCCVSTYTYGISNTGFTLRFYNGDSSNRNPGFTWIALGERA